MNIHRLKKKNRVTYRSPVIAKLLMFNLPE
jgi:hypothetical protein